MTKMIRKIRERFAKRCLASAIWIRTRAKNVLAFTIGFAGIFLIGLGLFMIWLPLAFLFAGLIALLILEILTS
jgi:CHASE2 domain-containing sensor protein